jgi:hypothetical protein
MLDRPTRDKIRELAGEEDRSMGSWIRLAIRERLERLERLERQTRET